MNRLLASFTFFTRLPFWKIKQLPSDAFEHIIPFWPFVGWLTGGIMAGVLWGLSSVLPLALAWIVTLISRVLVTGALHEDGFADFCDGFGGGTTPEKTLSIMKDSHIGTYGVLGLILYFLLMSQMYILPLHLLIITVVTADCFSKFTASQIINALPYSRKIEESKAKTVYQRMNNKEFLINACGGVILPIILLPSYLLPALIVPPIALIALVLWMKKRIGGYTGDCCGATFIICELLFYLSILICNQLHQL